MARSLTREYLIYKEGDFLNQLKEIEEKLIEIEKTFKINDVRIEFGDVEIVINIEGIDR